MSWHCFCEDSKNEEKPWVQIQVAFIDGGIPLTIVCHAECIRKALLYENLSRDGNVLKQGCESLDDEFEHILTRIRENKKDLENANLIMAKLGGIK